MMAMVMIIMKTMKTQKKNENEEEDTYKNIDKFFQRRKIRLKPTHLYTECTLLLLHVYEVWLRVCAYLFVCVHVFMPKSLCIRWFSCLSHLHKRIKIKIETNTQHAHTCINNKSRKIDSQHRRSTLHTKMDAMEFSRSRGSFRFIDLVVVLCCSACRFLLLFFVSIVRS